MADSEELRAGRQAAADCVQALREFQAASTLQNQESRSDYRPHLRRLFMAVRDGLGPISRCWHGTLEVFSPLDAPGSSKSTPVAPVGAWQSAVLVFWQVVCYTPYAWSAIVSWNNWDDGFDPAGDDDPSLRKWDAFVWYRIREAFASLDDKVWDRLIGRVNAEESSIVAGPPESPVRPPRFPERMRPLPSERYELEKLLRDVEGLIAEFENAQQHDEQIDRVTAMVAEDPSLLPDATRYAASIQKVPVPNVNKLAQLREFRIIEYASYLKQLVASNSENERIRTAMAKSREPSERQSLLQNLAANQRDSGAAFDGLLSFLRRLRKEVVTKVEELATTATTELIRGEVPGSTTVDELSRVDTTSVASSGEPVSASESGAGAPALREAPLGKKELDRLLKIKDTIDPTDIYIGRSPAILRVFEKIYEYNKAHDDIEKQRMKPGDAMPPAPILLLGGTGVGKTTIAELIHNQSCRRVKPFERAQTGTNQQGDFTITLGEWAGYGRGTGLPKIPEKGRKGRLARCSGGTIFIDEIDGATREFQSFLRDVLDDKEIPVAAGEGKPTKANVRLIMATNRDLDQCVQKGEFLHDLLARIRDYEIVIPPLSKRREDVFLFLERKCEGMKPEPGFLLFLLRYTWPGNVRQLIKVLEKAKSRASPGNRLTLDLLEIKEPEHTAPSAKELLAEIERMTDEQRHGKAHQEAAKIFQQQGFGKSVKGRPLYGRIAKLFGEDPARVTEIAKRYPF